MPERTDEMSPFAQSIYNHKYAMKDESGKPTETWDDTANRVATNVLGALGYGENHDITQSIRRLISERKFLPGGRYLYASGRPLHQTQNCLLLRAEDSREGWAELNYKATMALMTGAGIGIDYSWLRENGAVIKKTGGFASGPISLMEMINEIGRRVMQGGSRRSAIWAGLRWDHPDIMDFIGLKNWPEWVKEKKTEDFNFPATMDMTNISVLLDASFFEAYELEGHPKHSWAHEVYQTTVHQMMTTAEPGFSIDYENKNESLRNACTEVTSEDDSDICNLGSINLARIKSRSELEEVVELSSLFLLAGTVYSHVPYEQVAKVREKNRRLGLGVMGVHDWLLQRHKPYGPDEELATWLDTYARSTEYAARWADEHSLSESVATRAIAPTGTIGIIGETTTGIEPIFCSAFKRRYLEGRENWKYQYVIDPTAKRLVQDYDVDPNSIEDAYTLSYDVARRVNFQKWVQGWVDQGISSTVNLPSSYLDSTPDDVESFKDTLYPMLPGLRGITMYPDGARGGQPLSPVPFELAVDQEGVVFEESEERCVGGACGI